MKLIVAQKGAREHFAVARALHQQGVLAGLVTDWYAFGGRGQKSEFRGVPFVSRWFGERARAARAEGIPDGLVRAFPIRSLIWKWRVHRLTVRGCSYEGFAKTDRAFANSVSRLKLPPHDVFFGYSYASLETMEVEKRRGILTVLDQIDPGPVHFRVVADEMVRHPELAGSPQPFPESYFVRARREWKLADIVVVNSEWTREAMIAEGADPAKINILPLAFETNGARSSGLGTRNLELPLRALWLGQVTPGKGINYLLEAARLLEQENVHFDVVGPIGIFPGAVAAAPSNMTFHGPVSRDRTAEWYRQADVFVLPTLSDGFALTQLEAMAHGLPVIATPNCGRVVTEARTGFIVPPRDPQALAAALLRFVRNPNLAQEMSPACREVVKAFSVESYGKQLVTIIKKHLETRNLASDP